MTTPREWALEKARRILLVDVETEARHRHREAHKFFPDGGYLIPFSNADWQETVIDLFATALCLERLEVERLREAMRSSIARADDHGDSWCSRPIRDALQGAEKPTRKLQPLPLSPEEQKMADEIALQDSGEES